MGDLMVMRHCPECGQGHIFFPADPRVCDKCGASMARVSGCESAKCPLYCPTCQCPCKGCEKNHTEACDRCEKSHEPKRSRRVG
jgi:hypothetical protein